VFHNLCSATVADEKFDAGEDGRETITKLTWNCQLVGSRGFW